VFGSWELRKIGGNKGLERLKTNLPAKVTLPGRVQQPGKWLVLVAGHTKPVNTRLVVLCFKILLINILIKKMGNKNSRHSLNNVPFFANYVRYFCIIRIR
jgi:hypothetical protein